MLAKSVRDIMRKGLLLLGLMLFLPFVLIQLVPFGHNHTNPRVETDFN